MEKLYPKETIGDDVRPIEPKDILRAGKSDGRSSTSDTSCLWITEILYDTDVRGIKGYGICTWWRYLYTQRNEQIFP